MDEPIAATDLAQQMVNEQPVVFVCDKEAIENCNKKLSNRIAEQSITGAQFKSPSGFPDRPYVASTPPSMQSGLGLNFQRLRTSLGSLLNSDVIFDLFNKRFQSIKLHLEPWTNSRWAHWLDSLKSVVMESKLPTGIAHPKSFKGHWGV